MDNRNEFRGSLLVLLAGLCWGFQNVYVKMLSARGLGSMQIVFIKMLIGALCFSVLLLIKDRRLFRIEIRDIWMFIGTGIISITLYSLFGFYTAINGGVGIAAVLCYTSPIFIMLLSAVIFKEKITKKKVAAIAVTVMGCVLVAGIIGSGYRFSFNVIAAGILSGVFYGLYTIFSRFALSKYPALTVTAWSFIMGTVGSVFFADLPLLGRCVAADPSIILWGIVLGMLGAALPYLLYTTGLSMIESGKAAVLASFELVVSTVAGRIMYDEPMDILKLCGVALIIIAIIMLNIGRRPAQPV